MRLETDRLILRSPRLGDYEAWRAGHRAMRLEGPFDLPPRGEDRLTRRAYRTLLERIDQQHRKDQGHVFFGFLEGEWAATVSLFHVIRHELNLAYAGWHVLSPFRCQGLAVESVRGLLDLSFGPLALHQLVALCEVDNVASQKVAERVGLRFEVVAPRAIHQRGAWRDAKRYTLTEEEWPPG